MTARFRAPQAGADDVAGERANARGGAVSTQLRRGRTGTFWQVRLGGVGMEVRVRTLAVAAALLVPIVVCTALALCLGTISLSPGELWDVLTGQSSKAMEKVVFEWRMPRALVAIVLGGALGLSGAVFQSLTRNPLGSPDVVGFNNGAYTGVIVVTIIGAHGLLWTSVGAVLGGLATAGVVYLLAYRRGVQGFRFVIVGIAIAAMLASLNTWFSIATDLDVAMEVAVWGAGSLRGTTWTSLAIATIAVVVLTAALAAYGRRLSHLELGDDVAAVLGVPVERSKAVLIVLGVALTAVATAVAGPILFVALAAPSIARLLCRTGESVTLLGSAAVGAALVPAADLLAQHAFGDNDLPVGAVTICIGGLYLVWLLAREARNT